MHGIRYTLFAALVAAFAAIACGAAAPAATSSSQPKQGTPLPLGLIDSQSVIKLDSCPAGFLSGMQCYKAQVEGCANTDTLGFTYGYINPGQEPLGTIVMLEGGGGTAPYGDSDYAQAYLAQGYQIVFFAWDSDWEYSNGTTGNSIKNAGCRPATFLQYVYQNIYTRGAMCAQGDSGGSGALGYSLAWYGSSAFLDNVELLSGPVFGDIEQGCVVPNPSPITVCADGQFGCDGTGWQDSPSYVSGSQDGVGKWTGNVSCNAGQTTTSAANSAWKQMSIVDGSDNPSFQYPNTSMAGWLCSSEDSVQNNSAAQGEFFFQQFTSPDQTAGYTLTRINNCDGPEGVTEGQTPSGESGFNAISNHMTASCVKHSRRRVK